MEFLKVLNFILVVVGKSIFSLPYLLIAMIVYFLVNKSTQVDLYNLESRSASIKRFFENAMMGLIGGIIVSVAIVFLGLPIHLSSYLLLLVPISIALSFIDIRLICLSYSAAVLGVISFALNGQKIGNFVLPNLDLDIAGLLLLVGILHLAEGLLVFFRGHKNPVVLVAKKNNEVIQGHLLQSFWPIPFALLCASATQEISGGVIEMPNWWPLFFAQKNILESFSFLLIPFMGIIGFQNISFAFTPKQVVRKSSMKLVIYSMILVAFAMFSKDNTIVGLIGLTLMPLMHELMIYKEVLDEKKGKPLYTVPQKGVRVMSVLNGSIAEKLGFETGDIILKINDTSVKNAEDFKDIISVYASRYLFEISSVHNKDKVLEFNAYESRGESLGIRLLPERPDYLNKIDY